MIRGEVAGRFDSAVNALGRDGIALVPHVVGGIEYDLSSPYNHFA